MNVIVQILLGVVLSVLIPVAISCVQTLITELKHMFTNHINDVRKEK